MNEYGTNYKVQLQANVVYAHVENQCLKKGKNIQKFRLENGKN